MLKKLIGPINRGCKMLHICPVCSYRYDDDFQMIIWKATGWLVPPSLQSGKSSSEDVLITMKATGDKLRWTTVGGVKSAHGLFYTHHLPPLLRFNRKSQPWADGYFRSLWRQSTRTRPPFKLKPTVWRSSRGISLVFWGYVYRIFRRLTKTQFNWISFPAYFCPLKQSEPLSLKLLVSEWGSIKRPPWNSSYSPDTALTIAS
jgi:hypothetical protein